MGFLFDVDNQLGYSQYVIPPRPSGLGAGPYRKVRPLLFAQASHMKTIVYIDGFNLYYGAIRHTPYKWLNLCTLCGHLLPRNIVIKVKYFTAIIKPLSSDPQKAVRQQTYLRALRTLPRMDVILGTFLSHIVTMPIANPAPGGPKFAKVIKTEEKGSDVNIAAHMINDAHKGACDVTVLISNDSDLAEPVRIVREELKMPVGIINPHQQHPSHSLIKYASFMKQLRKGVLSASQLPPMLRDAHGDIVKPASW
jgi:uncharacterized LabA/DUF88 family protein